MGLVKCKDALGQLDCRIFKLSYLKNCWCYEVDFLHAGTYLLKLQIDDVILGRAKKSILVSGNGPGVFFYHSPARIVKCITIYIFNIKKHQSIKQAKIKIKKSKRN